MNKKRIFITIALMGSVFLPNLSYAETLKESVNLALSAHPSIEAAIANRKVNEEDKAEARSGYFPEIAANASAGRIYADNSTSRGLTVTRGASYSWFGEGNASVTQPIFDAFETSNRVNAAQARVLSAELNVSDVKENLALQAVQAHIAVAQAKDILAKIKLYQKIIEDYSSRIQTMVDDGVADEAELAQAYNISVALKGAEVDYEGQLEAAYANYREVVGQMPTGEITKPLLVSGMIDDNVNSAIASAKAEHPTILLSLKDIEAAKYDISAEKAGYYPDIDGEVSYLQKDQREEIGGEAEDARALLKMSWVFETGGGQNARTRRAKAQYSEVVARNSEIVRAVEGEIRRAYAEYQTAQKQMDLVQEREKAAQDLLEAYKVQFEGAIVRLLQIMQAENQLFNTQLDAITAEYRNILAQYVVQGSIGKITTSLNAQYINPPAQAHDVIQEVSIEEEKDSKPITKNMALNVENIEQKKIDLIESPVEVDGLSTTGARVSKYIDVNKQNIESNYRYKKEIEEIQPSEEIQREVETKIYRSTKDNSNQTSEFQNDEISIMATSGRIDN